MFGVLLVSFALAPILREVIGLGYILFLVIPAPLILTLGKRYISVPRIGIVKFGLNRQVAHKTSHNQCYFSNHNPHLINDDNYKDLSWHIRNHA
jgi:hypothetical protein